MSHIHFNIYKIVESMPFFTETEQLLSYSAKTGGLHNAGNGDCILPNAYFVPYKGLHGKAGKLPLHWTNRDSTKEKAGL